LFAHLTLGIIEIACLLHTGYDDMLMNFLMSPLGRHYMICG